MPQYSLSYEELEVIMNALDSHVKFAEERALGEYLETNNDDIKRQINRLVANNNSPTDVISFLNKETQKSKIFAKEAKNIKNRETITIKAKIIHMQDQIKSKKGD